MIATSHLYLFIFKFKLIKMWWNWTSQLLSLTNYMSCVSSHTWLVAACWTAQMHKLSVLTENVIEQCCMLRFQPRRARLFALWSLLWLFQFNSQVSVSSMTTCWVSWLTITAERCYETSSTLLCDSHTAATLNKAGWSLQRPGLSVFTHLFKSSAVPYPMPCQWVDGFIARCAYSII